MTSYLSIIYVARALTSSMLDVKQLEFGTLSDVMMSSALVLLLYTVTYISVMKYYQLR